MFIRIFYITVAVILISLSAPAQTRQWVACYNDSNAIYPNDVAVDSAGNSYITGYIQEPVDYLLKHFFVLKNNNAGQLQWINFFPVKDSFDVGYAIATDNKGNVYVTGERYDTACNICTVEIPYSYAFTIKYNAEGNIVWTNTYNGPPETNQTPAEIAVLTNGSLCTVINEKKYNSQTGSYDIWAVTQSINANSKTRWIRKIKNGSLQAITIDKNKNILVTGAYLPGNVYQLSNVLTMKYSANGDSLWQQKFIESRKNGRGYVIKTDNAGNVYVNGQTDTLTFYNVPRIITLKYAANGNNLWWQKEAEHTSTMPHFYGGYTIDNAGNNYIAGYDDTNYPDDNWVTAKRNSSGKLLWSKAYNDSIGGSDKPSGGIAVDAAGNVTVGGYSSFQKNTPFTTIQYDAAGNEKWIAFYKPGPKSYNYPYDVSVDANNNVYVSGSSAGICVVKYKVPVALSAAANQLIKVNSAGIKLFPDPAAYSITIQTGNIKPSIYHLSVSAITGATVLQKSLSIVNNTTFAINVTSLAAGNYILRLNNKEAVYVTKFQKL